MKPPPKMFSLPVVLCPSCGHGIDLHGTDPGGPCGVGDYDPDEGAGLCRCFWQPNDIAATLLADERERIAQAQEERARELLDNEHHSYRGTALLLARELPQIARNGGRDDGA